MESVRFAQMMRSHRELQGIASFFLISIVSRGRPGTGEDGRV